MFKCSFGFFVALFWVAEFGVASEQDVFTAPKLKDHGFEFTQGVKAMADAVTLTTRTTERAANKTSQPMISKIDVPMKRRSCSGLSWITNTWDCFVNLFFEEGSSFSDWVWSGLGDSNINEIMTTVAKRCGSLALSDMGIPSGVVTILQEVFLEQPGPFDAVICDIVNVARTGDISEFDLIHITECVEEGGDAIDKDCRNQFLSLGSKTDMLMTLLSAVTGFGWDESSGDSPDFILSTATSYRGCIDADGDHVGCLSKAFIGASCQGLCRTGSCQVNAHRAEGNEKCQDAVSTGCPAFAALVQQACSALYGTISNTNDFLASLGDPTQGQCQFCGSAATSSLLLTFVSFLFWSFYL